VAARLALAAIALCAQWAQAHEFKLDAVVNAFVKTEPGQVELIVRAPLYLFKSVRFPVAGVEIDVDNSASAVERALGALQKDIVLSENGRPMVSTRAAGRLSLPSDRSFETYEQATRHVATPVEPGTHIFIDQGYVDARIVYPTTSANPEISIRTTAAPELGDVLKLAVRYLPAGAESRALVVTRSAGEVALNPAGFAPRGLHATRHRPHPDRLRPPAVPALPARPAARLAADPVGRHRLHDRPLVHAARLGLRPRALGRLVSAVRGDRHRGIDRLHGAREHRRRRPRTPRADHRPVRAGARLRLLVRPERALPVRGHASAGVAVCLQRRHRARPDPRSRRAAAGAGAGAADVAAGTRGPDRRLRADRPHGLALDDRSRRSAVACAVAEPGGADIAVLALWLGFILLAAGGLSVLSRRLRIAGEAKVAPPTRALAD
jgi:hypothetical protein